MEPGILCGYGSSESMDFKEKSYGELIINSLKDAGNQILMINGVTGETLRASELLQNSIRIARSLQAAGIKFNDKISIIMENCFEFLTIAYGSMIAGITVSPMNSNYTEYELNHLIDIIRPKMIFTTKQFLAKISKVQSKLSIPIQIVVVDLVNGQYIKYPIKTNFLNITNDQSLNTFQCREVDIKKKISIILTSSGTTGYPKGILHPEYNMFLYYERFNREHKEFTRLGYSPIRFNAITFSHAFGFFNITGLITNKFTVVFLPRFQLTSFLSIIEKYQIEYICATPPMLVMLSNSSIVNRYQLSSIKYIFSCSAVLSVTTINAVLKRLGRSLKIRQQYGMSEIIGVLWQPETHCTLGAIGILRPQVLGKVVDINNGQLLGANQPGEMVFKSTIEIIGYMVKHNVIVDYRDKDGWCHTGDIGYYDENGEWYYAGRIKEIIKYKGYQVSPNELERLIMTHANVADACVIGIPNDDMGELVTAYVVKKEGTNVTEKEIIDYVAERISKPKHLYGGVRFISEIPKNNFGKILRRDLLKIAMENRSKL